MSTYLELLEEKKNLGIITTGYFKRTTEWYDKKAVQKIRDSFDSNSEAELIRIKTDASLYLQSTLVSEIKKSNRYLETIKGWVVFFGILQILSIVGVVIYLMNL